MSTGNPFANFFESLKAAAQGKPRVVTDDAAPTPATTATEPDVTDNDTELYLALINLGAAVAVMDASRGFIKVAERSLSRATKDSTRADAPSLEGVKALLTKLYDIADTAGKGVTQLIDNAEAADAAAHNVGTAALGYYYGVVPRLLFSAPSVMANFTAAMIDQPWRKKMNVAEYFMSKKADRAGSLLDEVLEALKKKPGSGSAAE